MGGADPYVLFDSVNDYLDATLTSAQPNSIFMVLSDHRTSNMVLTDATPNRQLLYFNGTTKYSLFAGSIDSNSLIIPVSTLKLSGGVFNGSASIAVQNSTRQTVATNTGGLGTTFRVGATPVLSAGFFLGARVRAIYLAAGHAASLAEIDELQTYVGKYGVDAP
jgi:hypothetical protein